MCIFDYMPVCLCVGIMQLLNQWFISLVQSYWNLWHACLTKQLLELVHSERKAFLWHWMSPTLVFIQIFGFWVLSYNWLHAWYLKLFNECCESLHAVVIGLVILAFALTHSNCSSVCLLMMEFVKSISLNINEQSVNYYGFILSDVIIKYLGFFMNQLNLLCSHVAFLSCCFPVQLIIRFTWLKILMWNWFVPHTF